jgi:membrane associated rhomboid family serine protease
MRLTPAVLWLVIACIAGYLLQMVTGGVLEYYFALWPTGQEYDTPAFRPWQLVTYAFLHDRSNLLHLVLNMYALYMFGPDIERLLGPRRFLTYYLVCVIGAAVAQLGVEALSHAPSGPTVGASGGIFGVLLAYGLAFPKRRLMLLFPPIPMPAWVFVTLYGLIELYMGISGKDPGVAHFAHLGGMVGGFLLILYWRALRQA